MKPRSLLDLPLSIARTLFAIGPFFGVILAIIGIFEMLGRSLFKTDSAFWPSLIFLFVILFIYVKRNSHIIFKHEISWLSFLLAFATVILPFLPAIYAANLMSTGEFANYFFNVDSPYHLSHVISLIQNDNYPPESLNNKGVFFNYHYGSQLISAAISKAFGLKPHLVYFSIVPGVFLISAVFCIYFVSLRFNNILSKCALLFVLLYSNYYLINSWDDGSHLWRIQSFHGGFPHISILTSISLATFLFYVYETWGDSDFKFFAVTLFPCIVLIFKTPFIFAFISFTFGYVFLEMLARRISLRRLYLILMSASLFLMLLQYVSNGNSSFIFMGFLGKLSVAQWDIYLKIFLFMFIPFIVLAIFTERDSLLKIAPYFLAFFLPFVFLFTFNLEIKGVPDGNIHQIKTLAPIFIYFSFIKLIQFSHLGWRMKISVMLAFSLIGVTPVVLNRLNNVKVVYENYSLWHEYVDNSLLASCLKKVPVNGALLVTNDLRYPAENYIRPMMQMQIPALFGHQMYAGNAQWEKHYVDKTRFSIQDSLRRGTPEIISNNAKKYGWTHGILFRREIFVSGNWPVICENEEVIIVKYTSVDDNSDSGQLNQDTLI